MSKNVYIDKLTDIVNKYNNTYHSTIKTKPVDVPFSISIEFRGIFLDISKAFNIQIKNTWNR